MRELVLASQSPRRKELMALLPWDFVIKTKEVEEIIDKSLTPYENVMALALQKAEAVAEECQGKIVIGADTVVCLEGRIMGKPKDKEDAAQMLKSLSGKMHQVFTGVALVNKEEKICDTFYVETSVKMQELSESEIEEYLLTKEPFDKAGAYGIQGYGARYIESIAGDYYNVMGLPVHTLYGKLKEILD